jgi:hypothetical protein
VIQSSGFSMSIRAGRALACAAALAGLARAQNGSSFDDDMDSVETLAVWVVLLFLHLLLLVAFCCCERPMTDPQRMNPPVELNAPPNKLKGGDTGRSVSSSHGSESGRSSYRRDLQAGHSSYR